MTLTEIVTDVCLETICTRDVVTFSVSGPKALNLNILNVNGQIEGGEVLRRGPLKNKVTKGETSLVHETIY